LKPLNAGGLWLAVIMTPPTALPGLDRERDGGVGVGHLGQHHLEAVSGKNFGCASREFRAEKAPVVADDHLGRRARDGIRIPKSRRGLRHALDVGKGEFIRNDRAPPVGAKLIEAMNSAEGTVGCLLRGGRSVRRGGRALRAGAAACQKSKVSSAP
jgi:hypothetical protein